MNYSSHVYFYTTPGYNPFTIPFGATYMSILIVGAGGGGGGGNFNGGGGGGGGGILTVTDVPVQYGDTAWSVYVGAGGAGGGAATSGSGGGNSAVFKIGTVVYQANGGAAGTGTDYYTAPNAPGSGGIAYRTGSAIGNVTTYNGATGGRGGEGYYTFPSLGGSGQFFSPYTTSFPYIAGEHYGSGGGGGTGIYAEYGADGGDYPYGGGSGAGYLGSLRLPTIHSGAGGGGGMYWPDCCGTYQFNGQTGADGLVAIVFHFDNVKVSFADIIRQYSTYGTIGYPSYVTSQGNGNYAVKFTAVTPAVGNRFFFGYPDESTAVVTSITPGGGGEFILYSPDHIPRTYDTWYEQNSPPFSLSDFYAGRTGGNVQVPSGAVGYPNSAETAVPTSGKISLSNFYGVRVVWPGISAYMTGGIYSGNIDADNLYFGGQIPNGAGWVYRRSNNSFGTFIVPSNLGLISASITIDTWTVYLDMGSAYTYSEDAYGHRSYTYYDDYMKDYGVLVFDNTLGAAAGTVVNPTQIGSVNDGTYGAVNTVPSGTVALIPGHTYSLYYYSGFYMTSNIGYGEFSFGWYNYSVPHYTVSGISR